MCYAIPGKVQSIEGRIARINYFGEIKRAVHELPHLAPGDYVYAQGGYVINKVSAAEAESVLSSWKEMFFTLQEMDRVYSSFSLVNQSADSSLKNILNKAIEGKDLTLEDARILISREKTEEINLVFKTANYLRHQYHKNACCVHGIVELSNYCKRNCFYCGISSYNKELERYRMSSDEVVDAVSSAADTYGFKAFVLQSGEDCGYGIDDLAEIISRIKQRNDCFIVISFGEMGEDSLRKLFAAGARGLLMRIETSNRALYEKLHPGHSLAKRVETIKRAYE
ncbi:MAG: HypC/HybG/HupF family hydrogenase formation chaperone, partial [Candidatus Omnitrophica bacterium]|nr:HypC/HybG/HupF family hydrogenase formation chaperone [Candidatus Omnitrophota bacterium]